MEIFPEQFNALMQAAQQDRRKLHRLQLDEHCAIELQVMPFGQITTLQIVVSPGEHPVRDPLDIWHELVFLQPFLAQRPLHPIEPADKRDKTVTLRAVWRPEDTRMTASAWHAFINIQSDHALLFAEAIRQARPNCSPEELERLEAALDAYYDRIESLLPPALQEAARPRATHARKE